jgi:predicted RNA-binding Zn-ribbon protein involved in translation (DUF1610 family)
VICPDCGQPIPRECREDIDSDEVTPEGDRYGKPYRDLGALYACPSCGAVWRFVATARRGKQLERRNEGVPTGRAFGAGNDEPTTEERWRR